MAMRTNIDGKVFKHLTVLHEVPQTTKYKSRVLCRCECGVEKEVNVTDLTTGNTVSCGCKNAKRLASGDVNRTHGKSKTLLYNIWNNMKQRCTNPNSSGYVKYGAKGITVSDEWSNWEDFEKWALSNGYKQGLSIDRKDGRGNYEPSNCRWVTASIQATNKPMTIRNTSGFVGVSKKGSKWNARVTVNGKRIHIGNYATAELANEARTKYIMENDLEEYKNTLRYAEQTT
jgi:hypothetical protein